MSSVLIVEDDPIIRQTVEYALKRAGFTVRAVADGVSGVEAAAEMMPDLLLLDLMLPGMSGYEVAEKVRAADKETAIIMVSALDAEKDKVRGLDVGADDYITKPFSMDELLARVRANLRRVRARETLADDTPLERGDLRIEPASFKLFVAGKPVKLRLKEFQLLLTLARAEGRLCTRQALAEDIWGYDHLPSSRTIDVHVRRIRQMVEEPSVYTYIQTVHGMGYRFEVEPKS